MHGSPRDPTWEYIYSSAIARANLPAFATHHCLVGHTHVPLVFREKRSGGVEGIVVKDEATMQLDGPRLIVNPGSVGQPRDGDPRACGMILDTDANTLEWHRVDYPIEPVQKLMKERKLPQRLISRLQFGL